VRCSPPIAWPCPCYTHTHTHHSNCQLSPLRLRYTPGTARALQNGPADTHTHTHTHTHVCTPSRWETKRGHACTRDVMPHEAATSCKTLAPHATTGTGGGAAHACSLRCMRKVNASCGAMGGMHCAGTHLAGQLMLPAPRATPPHDCLYASTPAYHPPDCGSRLPCPRHARTRACMSHALACCCSCLHTLRNLLEHS
jgi:hypothetical protein